VLIKNRRKNKLAPSSSSLLGRTARSSATGASAAASAGSPRRLAPRALVFTRVGARAQKHGRSSLAYGRPRTASTIDAINAPAEPTIAKIQPTVCAMLGRLKIVAGAD
jgi:hypothetical protein